ncbi:MAG: YkgJ family cysteine cluster protein [Desulfobacteraceae bacterium]|jgi:Fe-S-cluster containining protein|nr:YkgJ family cysteine cluster protein [Desulfobacteraceae bacterium]
MDSLNNQGFAECQRCGTCCKKGGPALHFEDQQLIDAGSIPLASLYTIRKGELARNNVTGGLICLPIEIIKIKSRPDDSFCMYYNDVDASCEIYDKRPFECRAMECWNSDKIAALYDQNRLTRSLVLEKADWLKDLVNTHEAECDLDRIQALVKDRETGDANAASVLTEMVNYDFHLRSIVTEKGKIAPDMLDFVFGRPLNEIISRQFKIKIEKSKTV